MRNLRTHFDVAVMNKDYLLESWSFVLRGRVGRLPFSNFENVFLLEQNTMHWHELWVSSDILRVS